MRILLITLFRNRAQLFRKAMNSVLHQTLSNDKFDYLLFNNGSEDGSDQLAQIYAKKYPHFHLFRSKENLGQQRAYNKILKEIVPKKFVKSTTWGILDDDDELYPKALKKVYQMYSQHPEIGGAYSGFSIVDSFGRTLVLDHGKAKLVPNQFSPEGQKNLRRIMVSPNGNPCGHFRTYSIKALNDIGGFENSHQYATDFNIFGHIIEKYPVVKIDSVLYKFRQHGNQIQGFAESSRQQTADWKYYQNYFRERWKKMGLI